MDTELDRLTHRELVKALVKPGATINANLTDGEANMLHMLMGIAGETGELIDALKKHIIYGKPLNKDHLIEEMGDIEFYLEGLRQELAINRDHVLEVNIQKLSKRYDGLQYSDQAANQRADKS